jgi:hypothetical protein
MQKPKTVPDNIWEAARIVADALQESSKLHGYTGKPTLN